MLRPRQFRSNGVAVAHDDLYIATRFLSLLCRLGCVLGEDSLGAAEIRNAHRRQLHAVQFLGRKRDWHSDDAIEDAVIAQDAPERPALTQQADVGFAQRQAVLPHAATRAGPA